MRPPDPQGTRAPDRPDDASPAPPVEAPTPFDTHRDVLELFEAGAAERGKVSFRPLFPDLVDRVVDDIYGFAYRRDALDMASRQLITLAVLGTMGDCDVQLRFHLRAALNMGIPCERIREVFVQIAVLAGNVRAINACAAFDEVLKSRDGSASPEAADRG